MEEFLENGPKFWVAYGFLALICFYVWVKFKEGDSEDSKGNFASNAFAWMLSALLLSAPLGWQSSRVNIKNKEEQAAIERQQKAEQAMSLKRAEVAKNRAEALKSQHPVVALKNNKILQNVIINSFNDDSISFTDALGGARVRWADLPDEWVAKFRDPVTAEASLNKDSSRAADIAAVEQAGRDVQVGFFRARFWTEAKKDLR